MASPTNLKRPARGATFIREWREYRGFTLELLAARIGSTHATLSRVERGKSPYSQGLLEALAEALATEPGTLLSMSPQANDSSTAQPARGGPEGELTIRTIAMPGDTNANGDIFGGWVMAQMDAAGGIAGVERAQGRVVTVAVDGMTFISPVRVGDVLCVYTRVVSVGRTSMRLHIEAWAERFRTRKRDKVTEAVFAFVAIGDDGKPQPVPLTPDTQFPA
ncbi:helix-turn-helix domain-containing protein [Micromonospora sp. STR1s_5]|nr:helix-turn-helix domain-containing protein [Micromonospora sp. STR1s_5]